MALRIPIWLLAALAWTACGQTSSDPASDASAGDLCVEGGTPLELPSGACDQAPICGIRIKSPCPDGSFILSSKVWDCDCTNGVWACEVVLSSLNLTTCPDAGPSVMTCPACAPDLYSCKSPVQPASAFMNVSEQSGEGCRLDLPGTSYIMNCASGEMCQKDTDPQVCTQSMFGDGILEFDHFGSVVTCSVQD